MLVVVGLNLHVCIMTPVGRRARTGYRFVGVVEEYARSLAALEALLRQTWPRIRLKAYQDNSKRGGTLEQRLEEFREQIGNDLYQQLEEANRADLAVWRTALSRYQST